MRRARQSVWCKALSIWVCILLCISGVPMASARAEDPVVLTTMPAIETEGVSTGAQDISEKGHAESAADAAAYMSGALSQKLKADDGSTYSVSVTFDESARIPVGAALRVELPVANDAATGAKAESRVERALALGKDDRVLTTNYLVVSIEADGHAVSPASTVDVEVQTDVIESSRSAFVEVVVMGEDADTKGGGSDEADTVVPVVNIEVSSNGYVIPQNLTEGKEDIRVTKLSFSTRSLGTIALASVAKRQDVWNGDGLAVSVLVPRQGFVVSIADETAPELEEGVDFLACYALQAETSPAYGTALLLEAVSSEEAVRQENERVGGVLVYLLDDEGGIPSEALCGSEGLPKPMELSAGSKLLLVWDSGYRSTTLDLADVTVEGMMPEGTKGTAREVTQGYMAPEALMAGLDEESARAVESGALEVEPLVAFDITLEAEGEEYQPDADHPLTVTIANIAIDDAVATGKNVQVWHIADDGTIEVIEDFEIADGSIRFKTSGFSTYLLVTQSETTESEIPLSSTFRIRASAKTYARASTVTFVDENQNPILSTVTGTYDVSFTGSGPESNETNTIDLYSFVDKLDPAIADEYEFSRVYVTLTATNQKDFRYIQVGDDIAIGGTSTTTYRAYFNMNGVAQNANGKDYYGTWYTLGNGGNMDNVYIEYYHVAPASFYALDTRNDPVEGAEFSLYTDADCYTPFEYMHTEIKATSDKQGLVSFGKIPRGIYYMKETVIPEGYKKSTNIYTVVVDGETPIANVVHSDDDGSVIIADVLKMKLTKQWDDGADKHAHDSVEVTVYAHGEPICDPILLNAANSWTYTLEGLDPNEPYMVSETNVTCDGTDVTKEWVPTITYRELNPHSEYYKADEFKKGKQYVILTTTSGGTRALVGDSALTTTPLAADEEGARIAGTVTDGMLWTVDTITKDGVIALQNVASGKYLDKGSRWNLNPAYPEPLYIRHLNYSGVIKFYHRPNLNSATSNYLYVWYDGTKEGAVDNYSTYESHAAKFDIYHKVNVRSVDVTIANKITRYPLQIKNVTYPNGTPLSGTTFDLYKSDSYSATDPGTPYISGLIAGNDGYLRDGDDARLELGAGSYVLEQTGYADGYMRLAKPVKFTITPLGALKVAQSDQEIAGFAYSTTVQEGGVALSVLQVPNWKPATFEVSLAVEGDYADSTRTFEFKLTMPEGMSRLIGTIGDEQVVVTDEDATFTLAHGQAIRFANVPATVSYTLSQAKVASYETQVTVDTPETVTVTTTDGNEFGVTLSQILGTSDNPARVTITNTLPNAKVFATGVDDNNIVWGAVVAVSFCAIAAVLVQTRKRTA